MIFMLPSFFDYASTKQIKFEGEKLKSVIETLFANMGCEPRDLFDKSSTYIKKLGFNPFSGETPTRNLANSLATDLKSLSSGSFDPLA